MSRVHRPRRQWRTLIEEQRVGGLTRRVAIRRVSSKWLLLSVVRDGFTQERGACRRAAAVRFSRASGTHAVKRGGARRACGAGHGGGDAALIDRHAPVGTLESGNVAAAAECG